jgi:hypothetical protein
LLAKTRRSSPSYRLEKDFARRGFPLARSTMNDLLHRTSELTKPLWNRLVEQIRVRPIVGADETRLLMQNDGTGKPKSGFVWTFVATDEHCPVDVPDRTVTSSPRRARGPALRRRSPQSRTTRRRVEEPQHPRPYEHGGAAASLSPALCTTRTASMTIAKLLATCRR